MCYVNVCVYCGVCSCISRVLKATYPSHLCALNSFYLSINFVCSRASALFRCIHTCVCVYHTRTRQYTLHACDLHMHTCHHTNTCVSTTPHTQCIHNPIHLLYNSHNLHVHKNTKRNIHMYTRTHLAQKQYTRTHLPLSSDGNRFLAAATTAAAHQHTIITHVHKNTKTIHTYAPSYFVRRQQVPRSCHHCCCTPAHNHYARAQKHKNNTHVRTFLFC